MADLELQIKASADQAVSAIERLENTLKSLSTTLSQVNTSGIGAMAGSVRNLTSAMGTVKGTSAKDFNKLASGLQRLAGVDTSKFTQISQDVSNLANSIRAFGGANIDKNMVNLVNAFNRLSQANLSNLQSVDFTNLGQQITNLATALSQAPAIDRNTLALINAIAKLSSAGANAQIVAQTLPELATKLWQFFSVMSQAPKVGSEVATLVSAIAQLASAGAKARTTADNLDLLGQKLKNLIATLSTAPQVSASTVQLVQALGQLASSGGRTSLAMGSMHSTMSRLPSIMNRTKKSTKGLVSAIGMFYARCFLLIRALKGLWSSIGKAMDFIEVYNYFSNAFGTVAEKAVDQWQEMGYESAQAYYDSFEDRALELTKKMTGYAVDESGNLYDAGIKNLGINPTVLMNYQAQFAQMSNSMGVSSENAMKLSSALTRLGSDLASIKNEDFETAWQSMASGMVGMSRAVDKYGINLRQSALQEKLNELGIQANVKALGQQEKALLRTIIMLDSSRYAWGDLARTLDQPRNQIRMLQASWESMCRTMGSLFMGVVAKIIPYINALLIALTRLFQYIAKLFGIEIPTVSSTGSAGMNDLGDAIGGVGDELDDANGKAKKLKSNLLGIDELNVINSDNDSGSGASGLGAGVGGALTDALDGILAEYDKAWEDAYNKLKNKVQDLVDKLIDYFKRGDYYGLGKLIADKITNALKRIDWDKVYEGAEKFGTGLAEFLNGLIQPEMFYQIGRTIAGLLNTAFHFIGAFVRNFDWKKAGVSLGELVNGFVDEIDAPYIARTISDGIKGILDMVSSFLTQTDFEKIGYKLGEFIKNIDWVGALKGIWVVIIKAMESLLSIFDGLFDASPIAGIIVTGIVTAFSYAKLVPIITKICSLITSSSAIRAFLPAGARMSGAIAEGMGGASAMTSFSSVASSIAGQFCVVFMGAVIGYHLGDWIAEQLYGEEWTLGNNKGAIIDFAMDDQVWNESMRQVVKTFEEGTRKVNSELDFTFKTSKLDTKFVDIATNIGNAFDIIRLKGIKMNDVTSVTTLLNTELQYLDNETRSYIGALSEQYDSLSASARMELERAYGIQYVNDGLTTQQYAVDATRDAIARYAQEMGASEIAVSKYHASIDTSSQKVIENTKHIVDSETKLATQKSALDATRESINQYINDTAKGTVVLDGMSSASDRLSAKIETQQRALDATKNAVSQYVEEQKKAHGINTETTDGYSEFIQALDNSSISASEFSQYVETLSQEDMPEIVQGINDFSEKLTELNSSLPQLKDTFQTTFEPFNLLANETFPSVNDAMTTLKSNISTQMPLMEKAVTGALDNILAKLQEVNDWYKENIGVMFEAGYWETALAPMESSFENATKNVCNAIIGVMNLMIDKINEAMKIKFKDIEVDGKKVFSESTQKFLEFDHIQGFMEGGFPQKSNLFYANENGSSEFIGKIGSNPAVANNDQIVQAVSNGVYNAVMSAMSNNESNVNVYLQGDAQGIFRVVREQNRVFTKQTGKNAFA